MFDNQKIPVAQIDEEILRPAQIFLTSQFQHSASRGHHAENTSRNTLSYGYDFFRMRNNDFRPRPTPQILKDVCASAVQKLEEVISRKLPSVSAFNSCLVSLYERGGKLEPHVDTAKDFSRSKFYFGDDIIGVVINADTSGKLYVQKQINGIRPVFDEARGWVVPEQDGCAALLTGRMRHYPYMHGVTEVAERRVSITFRTVEFK